MAKKPLSSPPEESKKSSSHTGKSKRLLIKKKEASSSLTSRSGRKNPSIAGANQEGPPADPPDLYARIADRAYELYTLRGGHHGQDQDDWFEAERQVMKEGC